MFGIFVLQSAVLHLFILQWQGTVLRQFDTKDLPWNKRVGKIQIN